MHVGEHASWVGDERGNGDEGKTVVVFFRGGECPVHWRWNLRSKDLTLPLRVSFFFLGGGCFGGLGVDTFFSFFFWLGLF